MAQQFDFKRYSVAEGMPHSQISAIHQDKKGFMWFGTVGGGLARFNGNNYRTFTRSNGLRDNVVNAVFEDSTGRFWVSTDEGGVGILSNNKVEYQFTDSPLDTAAVYKIKQSPDGRIWFATYGAGVFIYDGQNLEQLTVEDGLSSNFVWDFNFRKDGSVWMGTHNGLTIYNQSSADETIRAQTITDTLIVGGYAIYNIFESSDGKIWLATNNGVVTYQNGEFNTRQQLNGVPLGYTYSVTEDKRGNIWIGTAENGIFRQFRGDTFYQLTTENGLSSNLIYTLYKDRNDQIWVGTSEQGVNMYKGDTFVKYAGSSGRDWALLSVKFTRDHRLLVGTDDQGLWEVDYHAGQFSARQIGFEGEEIWVIEELANGHLLLLTGDNIIYEYDGRRVINYSKKIGLTPVPYTIDLFVDSNNNTWIGTNAGLYAVINDTLKHFDEGDGLANNFVWEISEHNDAIWIATNDGISIFSDGTFNNITTSQGMAHDITSTVVQDDQQDFWIGTSGGISHLPTPFQDSLRFENFDADSGLTFVDTQLLQYDHHGRLLQGTNAGLQILDIAAYRQTGKMKVVHFPLGENNTNLEYAHKAVDTDSTGAIWMGTTSGLLRYEPTMFNVDSVGPKTEISTLQINFQDMVRLENISSSDKVLYNDEEHTAELDYIQNNLTFTFSALEYKNPTDVEYRYRLKGFNNDRWSIAQSSFAVFTNLPARDYQFEVQAKNKYGYWGQTASFGFTIVPPYWQTYWFYALMLCLVIAAGYVFIKARVHYLEKRRLKELVDEKTQDLQSALDEKIVLIKEVHHRVKNNLAVISGLLELQLGKTDSDQAEAVLKESQRRVLAISLIHEKLYQNERLSEIDFEKYVSELIDIITYSFSHVEKDIEVAVEIRDDIQLNIDQSIPCGLIINELVSNAYEHAFDGRESGTINVIFSREGGKISLKVSDNGIGCTAFDDVDRESLGITLIENLAIQLEGELDVKSDSSGTTVVITFENNRENYRY